jgi:polyisoprenoid-binding protein YceI
VTARDAGLAVDGELTLAGTTRPLAFDLDVGDDGRLRAVAVVKQSEWGMKPYSALFGALKVADDVRVELDAGLPQSS